MSSTSFVLSNTNDSLPNLLVPRLYVSKQLHSFDESAFMDNLSRLPRIEKLNHYSTSTVILNKFPTPPHSPIRFSDEESSCDELLLNSKIRSLPSPKSIDLTLSKFSSNDSCTNFMKHPVSQYHFKCVKSPISYTTKNTSIEAVESQIHTSLLKPIDSTKDANILSVTKKHTYNGPDHRRQRQGLSCDCCRSKKRKCNAKIKILLQNKSILRSISKKLHYVLKKKDIVKYTKPGMILENINIPKELFEDNDYHVKLIKHIDKIILFNPCSACHRVFKYKKKNVDKLKGKSCVYSSGFTRSDINVFNIIMSNRSHALMTSTEASDHKISNELYDLTVSDYKEFYVNDGS